MATIAVLGLLCAGFVVVSQTQGPKLDETQVDTTAVTQDPGQQARLFVGGAVSHVTLAQVHVSPAVPITVQTIGTVIAVQFTDRLSYSTEYRVTIDGVTSVDGSRASTLTTHFTTASASVLTLVRSTSGPDQIVEAHLRSPGRRVVYAAVGIQAFGAVGDDLVVVTARRGVSTMWLVARGDGTTERLLTPANARITSFAVDPPTGAVVFGVQAAATRKNTGAGSEAAASSPLYTLPLSGNHLATPLLGPGHAPVAAASWYMEQGAPVVFARTVAGRVDRVDLSLGGRATVVADPAASVIGRLNGTAGVDLQGGRTARIVDGKVVATGPGGASRVLYAPASGTRVVELDASPNGQFAAVVTAPVTARGDGRTIDPLPLGASTLVVDAASGAVAASFTGAHLDW